MNKSAHKIQRFTDLVVWQEAHKLVLMVYAATKAFPPDERFSLTDQVKRAAVSITSNIAEGFCKLSSKEKTQYYITSKASLIELQNHLLIAKDVSYLPRGQFERIAKQTVVVFKLLNGLLKATRLKKYEIERTLNMEHRI